MSAKFNQILFLDSLPEGENTAARLYADVSDWAYVMEQTPAIVFRRVPSAQAFIDLLRECAELAAQQPYVPLLHIECHGREEGLAFADGSQLTWADMKPAFVALNTATRLNLIVIVAACFGGSIGGSARVEERAPFWAFLAPKREIGAGILEDGLSVFYQTLLRTRTSEQAMAALRATEAGKEFWQISAHTIFQMIVKEYEENHLTDGAVQQQAARLRAMAAQQGAIWSQAQVEAKIRDPAIFERFRQTFFMIDIFPEHAERFSN
ncbi:MULTISPECIES: hypothetical protein [Xanthomonas]|uniref:CHAT domain-containing protein n=1 Tax=Xanthomonas cucurbitae TaxID=56453 RepID=A0ABY7YG22_9XANT|nr:MULTISPECIES: hypothetical protein [Xanthomonas]MBO9855816.1 hypothetical protein [Xanthomonas sp. A1809]MBZ2621890.1 hypothetical protein [Xanthomonas perforans]WDM68981.1 hypothetical protein K6981_06915 [Xanthomonas cucurbitae]WDM72853.1 hypothetical protein K6978_06895 [Xanthomonas cucurbitae]